MLSLAISPSFFSATNLEAAFIIRKTEATGRRRPWKQYMLQKTLRLSCSQLEDIRLSLGQEPSEGLIDQEL